jgi:hypothetical protein
MEAGFSAAPAAAGGDRLGPYGAVQRANARQLAAAFRASMDPGKAP